MDDFSGQKVIVTGATRGIGRSIATAFLQAGADVIAVYSSNQKAAEEFRHQCGDHGSKLHLFQCDVASHDAVEELFAAIEEQFDVVDVLVNNAGIRRDGVVAMLAQDDWQRVIDVNLTGTFNMSKQAVMLMMKQKYGRIINITSPMSRLGFAGQANYSASKAGQIAMMHSLAKEVAKRKITVNCVSPGFIETELLDDLTAEQISGYKKLVPLRRFGTTDEVAHAVLFLASARAAYITDSVLEVSGGI